LKFPEISRLGLAIGVFHQSIGMNGKILNQKWGVMAKHALYRKTGDWYHRLENFPGALFDANGYVLFRNENEFLSSPYLQIKNDVHVPSGISNIPSYVKMSVSKPVNRS
jgi:5-methylcytosine-specific restriction protein A